MSEQIPDPATLRKRRLGRTVLGCLFFGWVTGLSLGAAMGNVGVGISVGAGAGSLLGLVLAGVNGDLRRPPP